MENKQIVNPLVKGDSGRTFLHTWFGNLILRILNKQWVVSLPPNCGVGTVKDSPDLVTIDLSRLRLLKIKAGTNITIAVGADGVSEISSTGGGIALPGDGLWVLQVSGGVGTWTQVAADAVDACPVGEITVIHTV